MVPQKKSIVRYICIPLGKVHEANMGSTGTDRTQVGPMLAPWTLLSRLPKHRFVSYFKSQHRSRRRTMGDIYIKWNSQYIVCILNKYKKQDLQNVISGLATIPAETWYFQVTCYAWATDSGVDTRTVLGCLPQSGNILILYDDGVD